MPDIEIVVVGAGPTGLVLALWLAKLGVGVRIIEKNERPGEASRAMVVQARTLEFYRQIGIADDVVEHGIKVQGAHVWDRGRDVAHIRFGDFGKGLSPYPFALSFPQDDHERLLSEQLTAAGVNVEWSTELVGFADDGSEVRAKLRHGDVDSECVCSYVCGCDGAHSTVRRTLGLTFSGGTYDQRFFVADVAATGEAAKRDTFSICLRDNDFFLMFPIRSTGMHRLVGVVPQDLGNEDTLTFAQIQPYLERVVGLQTTTVNWFSIYTVHHRVAQIFRSGRAFILGDAGHVHSPAGGQGMNTGIGDAVNLAWKLAAALRGHVNAEVLDTYDQERGAFARSLVDSTDRAFKVMVNHGIEGKLLRDVLLPHVAPLLLGFHAVRTRAFRFVSQIRINYRDSALSSGACGEIHGGDRLPWVESAVGVDNFEPLKSLDWQVHVYGEAQPEVQKVCENHHLSLHTFAWTKPMAQSGLRQNALYLIRPDGYIGLAAQENGAASLLHYIEKHSIATADSRNYNLGSTGSLSSASTAKAHS